MGAMIIAEAGVNHNGDILLAKKMIEAAKEAGADYIKFQTFIPQDMVASNAQKADYQKESTAAEESQQDMLKKLALTFDEFKELKEYCEDTGIGFLSTPFDFKSIEFLQGLDLDFWKVPSGEITNLPYLKKLAKTGKPMVLSTGMCTLQEVSDALKILYEEGISKENITLLQCNTEYPTPYKDVNLKAMKKMSEAFEVKTGYSDHTKGIEIPLAAVAMGAAVIEKHFTLDRRMEGPDHKASLEPQELKDMITGIRHIEEAMGNGEKKPTESEKKNIAVARKSIVADEIIQKGELFTEDNLTVKRPGDGISPMKWYDVIGKTADRNYEKDEKITGEFS